MARKAKARPDGGGTAGPGAAGPALSHADRASIGHGTHHDVLRLLCHGLLQRRRPAGIYQKPGGLCRGWGSGHVPCLKINYQTFRLLSVPGIVAAILLLVLALSPPGSGLNEVKRWVRIGPIQFQPSEVAKVAVIPVFATRLSKRDTEKKKKWSRRTSPAGRWGGWTASAFWSWCPMGPS